MFWTLLLAHFIADYPLQSDGMVLAKKTLPGLLMHIGIHLVTAMVLLFPVLGYDPGLVWPYPVAAALSHLLIDALKNKVSEWRPKWIIRTYLVDQLFHILATLGVARWFETKHPDLMASPPTDWVISAIAFVMVTHFALITEKVCLLTHKTLLEQTLRTGVVRMAGRAVLLSGLLLIPSPWMFVVLAGGFLFHLYDLKGQRLRVFLLDTAWVTAVWLFLHLASP